MLAAMKSLYRPSDFQALSRRLDSLRPDSPRQWGRMSPGGAVCHLTDAYKGLLGERSRPAPAHTGPASLRARTAKLVRRLYGLTSPLPWPKGIPTPAPVDQEKGGTPPGVFEDDVEALRAAMTRFRDRDGRDMAPHVLFGKLTRGEWGRWAYRHMDHHLRQFGA